VTATALHTGAAARVAAGLAFASAAVTLYWTLGGTLLLDTVGGDIEQLARDRSVGTLALGGATFALKLLTGLLALALAPPTPRRALVRLGLVGGVTLALYGGVLTLVGALVVVGAIDPGEAVDEHALRWHVLVWDPWFLVWGLALVAAGVRARVGQAI